MQSREWRDRLIAVIKSEVAQGRSLKEISLSAGLGANFAQQLLTTDKIPTVDALMALCQSLRIDAVTLFEDDRRREAQDILTLASRLPSEDLKTVLEFARYLDAKVPR